MWKIKHHSLEFILFILSSAPILVINNILTLNIKELANVSDAPKIFSEAASENI